MSRCPELDDAHSDIETASTVGYSTPSTAATAPRSAAPSPSSARAVLFQTPFVSTSTLEFNRNILSPAPPSPERQLLLKKRMWAGDENIHDDGEREYSKEARRLALRWAMVACFVGAIAGAWTVVSVREYGGPELSGWLYVGWAEVVLDMIQVVLMWLIGSRCRRRECVERDELEESLRRLLSRD
ncbi:hypothetical protein FA13DRAFT_1714443 [Coprinellus micaceus]|uniref:Uncharacterized protein n=1 Tax=Coprinellus micaceus TaxID=71717 RepID=A0A4Y7SU65_COPMI|nr:hypothetical protein FA13DRAFT_1714443 [Coprinellus micaceus]